LLFLATYAQGRARGVRLLRQPNHPGLDVGRTMGGESGPTTASIVVLVVRLLLAIIEHPVCSSSIRRLLQVMDLLA
jgi:hypothetical protein